MFNPAPWQFSAPPLHTSDHRRATQIWAVMNNCAGVGGDVVLSKGAFEVLVRAALQQMRTPAAECLRLVARELLLLADLSAPAEMERCGFTAMSL